MMINKSGLQTTFLIKTLIWKCQLFLERYMQLNFELLSLQIFYNDKKIFLKDRFYLFVLNVLNNYKTYIMIT